MGSIESYETRNGKRYRARYRDPERVMRMKAGFTRKKDAQDFLAETVAASNRGEYVNPNAARATIRELGDEWLLNQAHLKPSSYRPIETSWRLHIAPAWGDRRVSEIRHSEVQSWFTKFAANDSKPRSATIVTRAYGVLCGILDTAVRDRRLLTNPARGVKMPKRGDKTHNYLTPVQVELMAKHSGEHATIVYTLAYTGIRWGEAVGLRVSAVNLERRRMMIRENAVIMGAQVHVGTTKSHENRSVSFPQFLAERLTNACAEKSPEQLVFGKGDSHQMRPGSGKGWFHAASNAARLEDPTFPVITPHDLRHTAASIAISAGANVKAVQRMLGHASAAMTLDTYADLFEDDLDAVSERMDEVRAKTLVRLLCA